MFCLYLCRVLHPLALSRRILPTHKTSSVMENKSEWADRRSFCGCQVLHVSLSKCLMNFSKINVKLTGNNEGGRLCDSTLRQEGAGVVSREVSSHRQSSGDVKEIFIRGACAVSGFPREVYILSVAPENLRQRVSLELTRQIHFVF